MKYELIEYDVWGNRRDGFEINEKYRTGVYVNIPDEAGNVQIIRILKNAGIIKKSVRHSSVEIEGEEGYNLYFTHGPTGQPVFELEAV